MDERGLLKRLRNGDEKAFEKIMDMYSAYIVKIVGSLISPKGTKEDIEEVVADTFIALWQTAERINYEKYSSIKAYIAVIARNKAKDWLRNVRGQDLQLMDDALIVDNSLEQLIVQREQQRIIESTLKQLKPLDWKIFVAYYYQYRKVEEIAREFQMNPQTVKTRLRRGREMLKKILIKEGYNYNEN
ncbi:MAG: sigma-70 family RNA polymerase sigma factor [Lachnospiraceae bacterium]|nr:sigma-70 family RNA polymerase sigma factor [Lachnospiraceae bacterium]